MPQWLRSEPAAHDAVGVSEANLTERVAEAMLSAFRAYVASLLNQLNEQGYDGLTSASIALLALPPPGGTQAVEVSRLYGRSKQATGKLLAELEVQRYVERIRDPHDQRAKLVRPTDRGASAIDLGLRIKETLSERAEQVLGANALNRLYADLDRLEKIFTQTD